MFGKKIENPFDVCCEGLNESLSEFKIVDEHIYPAPPANMPHREAPPPPYAPQPATCPPP